MSLKIPFGKYYLTEKIATGGMAELFRAKRIGVAGFEKLLVIKKILPHLSLHEEFVSMFINEAKIAAQLSHTNIAQIFDLGKIEDSYYIAMEYVWGKDLKAVLKKGKEKKLPVSMEHALQIVSKACAALDYAHKKKDLKGQELNLIHRDVSPQNILVSYDGDVKIVDFGIAKAASKTSDTRTGVLKGKIAYMSPEQAWGRPIDRRSDIFSLGIVLYELLTGEMLFKGDTDLNTLERVREAKVIPPTRINKEIPKEIENILLKALAKEPQERYQYASEMQNDLETYIHANKTMPGTLNLQNYVQTLFKEEMEAEAKALEEEDTVVSTHLEKTMAAPIGGEKKPAAKAVSKRTQAKKEEDALSAERAGRVSKKREGGPIKYIVFVLLIFTAGSIFLIKPELLLSAKKAISDYLKPTEPVVVSQGQIEQTKQVSEKPAESPVEKEAAPIAQKVEEKKAERIEEKREIVSKQLGYGGIVIESTPLGADIFLDNKDTGLKTPASIQNLTANEGHNIRLTLKGYKEWTDTITVKDNERITVTSKLKRLYASVLVDSKPEGAAIFINNQDTSKKTPATFAEINPNEPYNIKLHLYGYEDWGRTITLKEEEYTTISPKLSRFYGSITINAIPWAEIFIEGESKGTTPLAGLRLPVGKYSIKLINQELKIEKSVDVKIEHNETAKVVVEMK